MMVRKSSFMLGAVVLLLIVGTPLHAGGWVVVTLDALPAQVYAGEAIQLGFSVRQHGQTLVNLGDPGPAVVAHQTQTGERVEAVATQTSFTGYYTATLTLPTPGLWAWQIEPQPFNTVATMPDLTVHTRQQPTIVAAKGNHPFYQWLASVQAWLSQWHNQPVVAMAATEKVAVASQGQKLFLAKGCASCHHHEAVVTTWSAQSGPDLTHYDKSATFLQLWLADPAAVKPTTEMPNLQLSQAEIEALTDFLTNPGNQ
ncbi:MAG: c-type cytochrome [Caldilineaceae bacterium]